MKFNILALTIGVAISMPGILLLGSNTSLASPVNVDQSSDADAASPSTVPEEMTEGMTEGQAAPAAIEPVDIEQPGSSGGIEQPSSFESRAAAHRRSRAELGFCSAYIPPYAEPGSFAYQEGLNRCWYGSD